MGCHFDARFYLYREGIAITSSIALIHLSACTKIKHVFESYGTYALQSYINNLLSKLSTVSVYKKGGGKVFFRGLVHEEG